MSQQSRHGWAPRADHETKMLRNAIKLIMHKIDRWSNDVCIQEQGYLDITQPGPGWLIYGELEVARGELTYAIRRYDLLVAASPGFLSLAT